MWLEYVVSLSKTNRKLGKMGEIRVAFEVKKEEEEVDALCSCFYFSAVCTEKQFHEEGLPCSGNKLFARKQRSMVVSICFPTSSSSSCCFCPCSYLLLVYTFQPLFSALSYFPALLAFSSIQLHHPEHSFQTSSLLEKPDAFYSEVQYSDGRVWSHAVKGNTAHHTHNPITQRPVWAACCSA